MRPESAQDPVGLLQFVYDMQDVIGGGIMIRGGDPFAPGAWEVGQVIFDQGRGAFERRL
jgi:hypothetical protein